MKQKVAILGATGSIGTQTLSVVSDFPEIFSVTFATSNHSFEALEKIAKDFNLQAIGFHDKNFTPPNSSTCSICRGNEQIIDWLLTYPPDILVVATAGVEVYDIIRNVYPYIDKIAISSKEAIIMSGITGLLFKMQKSTKLLPIDSEHVAIHQLLKKINRSSIKKVVLTASGGPFYRSSNTIDFETITPEKALAHPTWIMGKKVTIDSATLVNKGIELMEAFYLFGLPLETLDVVIHPESIIHGMVETVDGSLMCQMAYPNMELPIAYALFYPDKKYVSTHQAFDYAKLPGLSFRPISARSIPTIQLALEAIQRGSLAILTYLISDEIAVELFLNGKISFNQIGAMIDNALHLPLETKEINEVNIVKCYFDIKKQIEKEGLL